MFKKHKKNNKGYSLMELIVSFAILGFVAIAVLTIMNAGTSMFSSVDSEINLQSKSQIAMAQFQQYFLSCKGICVEDYSITEAEEESSAEESTTEANTEENQDIDGDFVVYVVNEEKVYAFRFCEEEQKIFFGEAPITTAATDLVLDKITDPFCSDVADFGVKVIHSGDNAKSAKITLTVTSGKGSKTYTTSQNFSFRNKSLYVGTADNNLTKLQTMINTLTGVTTTSAA